MMTWLFQPFTRVAGAVSLLIGCGALLVTALTGWWLDGVYTDGVLDLHAGPPAPFLVFLALNVMAWLVLSICLLAVGHCLTSTRYRIVDLLGTQAMARWPTLPAALLIGMPVYRQRLEDTVARIVESGTVIAGADIAIVLALSVLPLAATVWMVWLMYHSYSIVFNLKGSRAGWSFALTLIAAEVLSKLVSYALLSK